MSELIDENGLINILNFIPVEEIVVIDISYIRSHFDEKTYGTQFDLFWKYFIKTWMKYYDLMHWSINQVISRKEEEMEDIFINRTNTPLEWFNRI